MARNPSRRQPLSGPLKVLIGLVCAALFAAGIYLGVQVAKPPERPDFGRPTTAEDLRPLDPPTLTSDGGGSPRPPADAPVVEGPRGEDPASPPIAPASPGDQPRVAIVIDDLGRSLKDLDTLAALGIPLTYSVLPFESHTPAVVAELGRRGVEILCHLPMEAKGNADPGPGALELAMSHDQLVAATERALAAVPGAVGMNNHMGSAIVSDQAAISTVLEVLVRRRLYFLDSRTSVDTLGLATARRLGLRAGERQVFLDTEKDESLIEEQFDRLLHEARQRGAAIAIAHPYAETLAVLARRVGEAQRAGIRFVVVSEVLQG